ncbi:hypothetical protein SERLA73DRAFT_92285 [Serpula lacrymans var. lacrymans S7.3]|uniref:CCAAT-binding factor domain-containing protein n=2 Tax=Serpula lacrymans var. lacrymans TaxID=341189 RepID=F8Q233_SERL3|nr:hypothetical protein SERLA73DRAFT_92285 [Serpula lacrymans var. lacrymans S7.3]
MDRASSLHSSATSTYQSHSSSTLTSSKSEYSFLQKILQSGTLSDRLSALTLLVQSSPVYNIKALETLKGMAERGKGKGGREESLKALRCIVDWWVGGGGPSRKLKYFRDQPLLHPSVTDQHLLLWYFEDWLKKFFFSILQILETLSLDPLSYVRMQALSLIHNLLLEKPEQEHNLLRLLVNKLGDTEKSVCSRVSYHLLQLLQLHPFMKAIIVREMTSLILRPPSSAPSVTAPSSNTHIRFTDEAPKSKSKSQPAPQPKKTGNDHARYYATITFNQIVFGPGDREVALQIIDVYFQMFKDLLGEGSGLDEPEPVATVAGDEGKEKKKGKKERDSKGKGKVKPKNAAVEVGAGGFTEVEDAHSKLISAILAGVNRALPYAKLSATDVSLNKHIDTLFLITHTSTFNISLQALVLIQQISFTLSSNRPQTPSTSTSHSRTITDRYYRTLYASLHDVRLAASSKQAMYLNLLFKSLKADDDVERVKSFVRRFIQILVSGGGGSTEFIVGGLYLLGELFSTVRGMRDMLKQSTSKDNDEEYDPKKRDPRFAHPSSSPLFELIPLLNHYHPTVSLHAQQLLDARPITSSADLSLNTLSHFLDRFVYKNPKKPKPKGASAMQPAASAADGIGVKLTKGEVDSGILVNDEKFWRRKVENIPVDEVFFHKYFSRKNEKQKAKPKKTLDDEEESSDAGLDLGAEDNDDSAAAEESEEVKEEEEEGSDAEEAEIWKAMKATMPAVAGDGDDDLMEDSDSVPSDLDDMSGDDADNDSQENINTKGGDAFSLAEESDNEDLIDLDNEVAEGLIEYDGSDADDSDAEEAEWGGFSGGQKRKREETASSERKKLRALPTFASYEDYAKMIENEPEDNI